MTVRVTVLGPLTAEAGGTRASLGGPRQRAVLAVLVAARGRLVPAERIVEDVWEGREPPSAATLHSYIARLRKALEPGRASRSQAHVLVREGDGYLLRLDPDAVDAERFTRLAEEGRRLLERERAEAAEAVLSEALELWRGRPYAEFADAAFAVPEIARLEGLRRAVQEDLFAARLALGRHAAIVGDLEKYTAAEPLSERGWELLTLALYRAGRQGDALAALRAARTVLAEELGVDPGPALRRLEASVLAQEEMAAPPQRSRRTAGNLPFALTGMVGRTDEVVQVSRLLERHRLVTLTGPGGIGKTRLALEAARGRRDDDGPWLVELAGLADPALLAATVAETFQIAAPVTPGRVAQVLAGRELLLVLDNCEHLVDAAREMVTELLTRTAGVRVLATSREVLGVPGEVVYDVPALADEAARELFVDRAATVLPGWRPTPGELETAGRLCAELDGLPLAIELAAARCRMLSVEQIADALDDRFAVLTGGTGPRRHRTLLRTVEWSHRLLDERERRAFHRLAVFAAGFDLDAATAVCGEPMLDVLTSLVAKSLVTVEPGTSPRRYRLLETLKEFARVRQDPAELAAAQAAHRAWVIARAEQADLGLRGHQAPAAMRRLASDQPEHRAAFTSALLAGDGDYALRLCGALVWFWYRRGHITEGLGLLAAAMELNPDGDPALRARALLGVAALSYLAGDFATASRVSDQAADTARSAGDLQSEGLAFTYRALFAGICGAPNAVADARAALDVARLSGERWLEAEALMGLGMLLLLSGEAGEAHTVLTDSVGVARECGHRFVISSSSWLLMKTELNMGDPARALAVGAPALRMLYDDGDVTSGLVIAHTSAAALAAVGRPHDAARLLGMVEELGRRCGFSPLEMDPVDAPRQVEQVRAALSPAEFESCRESGRTLECDQILAMVDALQPSDVR